MPNGSHSVASKGGGGDSGSGSSVSNDIFISFLERWLVRQEHYLDELLSVEKHCHESRVEDLMELISRILSHYQQYYEEKSRFAQHDIFLLFSPPWLSPLENSFLWITGFKPGLAFGVLESSVNDLSEDQSARIATLKEETKFNERLLNDELAKVQESVAAPPQIGALRRKGRVGVMSDGFVTDGLASAMEAVVARADMLRADTVTKVVNILNPVQNVKFLTAITQLQLKIRNMGLQKWRLH